MESRDFNLEQMFVYLLQSSITHKCKISVLGTVLLLNKTPWPIHDFLLTEESVYSWFTVLGSESMSIMAGNMAVNRQAGQWNSSCELIYSLTSFKETERANGESHERQPPVILLFQEDHNPSQTVLSTDD